MPLSRDHNKPRINNVLSLKLSNGFVLPEGKLTPNAVFVGGIDMKVDENEMRDYFARYGTIREVKIITYRGGICKGYGFVYFKEDVNIQTIIEQPVSLNGRRLKLGPAIMKERGCRSSFPRLANPAPWPGPVQYYYCTCCSPVGGVLQSAPMFNQNSPYNQMYTYSNYGGIISQMPMNYSQNAYTYQYPSPQWMDGQRTQPVNQSGGVTWLSGVSCPACDHPAAPPNYPPTPTPSTQSDVSK
ncbi:deleted in azoospermia-like [Antennarius striatus]|uniref:deleted in azoospermia-like n=1 Tax=Antennarius striatus TaxID=241820 RepID=UPI0035B37054